MAGELAGWLLPCLRPTGCSRPVVAECTGWLLMVWGRASLQYARMAAWPPCATLAMAGPRGSRLECVVWCPVAKGQSLLAKVPAPAHLVEAPTEFDPDPSKLQPYLLGACWPEVWVDPNAWAECGAAAFLSLPGQGGGSAAGAAGTAGLRRRVLGGRWPSAQPVVARLGGRALRGWCGQSSAGRPRTLTSVCRCVHVLGWLAVGSGMLWPALAP